METGSHYVAEAGLELVILLPQPPTVFLIIEIIIMKSKNSKL
jgi:hypothetical protein